MDSHFSDGRMKAPNAKRSMLLEKVYPVFGNPKFSKRHYIALESNSATRAMYRNEGIKVYTQSEVQCSPWLLDWEANSLTS